MQFVFVNNQDVIIGTMNDVLGISNTGNVKISDIDRVYQVYRVESGKIVEQVGDDLSTELRATVYGQLLCTRKNVT